LSVVAARSSSRSRAKLFHHTKKSASDLRLGRGNKADLLVREQIEVCAPG
jgi:hypothetical protein